jgi:parallel beta-helix repeat protein
MRVLNGSLLAFIASAVVSSGAPVASAAPTVNPVADTFVDETTPGSNYGRKIYTKVDASPDVTTFVRFSVSGFTGTAQLRVFVESANSRDIQVFSVPSTTWDEATTTYQNAPAVGSLITSASGLKSGTWAAFNVSGGITGDGLVSFALKTSGSTSMKLTSREGTNRPQLLVPAPASPSPYLVTRVGSSYHAVSQTNGTTYDGSLKFVGESAVADLESAGGGTVTFGAGDFDFGTEFFKLASVHDIVFEGQGIDVTTLRNSTSASADTEPFDFSGATRVTIRDMTISAGGPARSTSDAIDMDRGNDSVIERVKIIASRGRGIVFDGKNTGWTSQGNTVRDCVISATVGDGIELLASTNNTIQGCTITNVGGHGIQINKSSTVADQPNKKASDNLVAANTIDQAGQDGINVTSGDRNTIRDNVITNSSDDTSGRDGIRITSTDSVTCNDTVVSGNTATDNQAVKTQRYGLDITSSLCNRTVVGPGNNFAGNRTAALRNLGTGTIFA